MPLVGKLSRQTGRVGGVHSRLRSNEYGVCSSFLRAHATVQKALCDDYSGNAPVAISDDVLKETAPICEVFEHAVLT